MLPPLREDLLLFPGARGPGGEPAWVLQDPARNQFFQLDWLSYELLSRWSLREPSAILDGIRRETPLEADDADLTRMCQFLSEAELVRADSLDARAFAARQAGRRKGLLTWLMHNYLFMRFPLVRPDRALDRLLPLMGFVFRREFLIATLAALLFGLWQAWLQWAEVRGAFARQMSGHGLAAFGLTLVFVKAAHELGHALIAKRFGCRVPTMGLALMVLWPMAYTDTTEAWRLRRRSQRLLISSGGMIAEFILAGWATALWAVLPEGPFRQACFVVGATSWVSTLLVNLNPLMRFDGYYLLSDALETPNLHARAFALARWKLRELLFGLGEPPPEDMSRRRRGILIAVAWGTWAYRIGVYLGIALLVYHFFIKPVGIALFVIEVWFFILAPVHKEVQGWWERRSDILGAPRTRWIGGGLVAAALLLAIPLPTQVTVASVLSPAARQAVAAPQSGRLASLPQPGAAVRQGQVVAQLTSPQLERRMRQAEAALEQAQAAAAGAALSADLRSAFGVSASQLASAEAALATVQEEGETLQIRAAFSGRIIDVNPEARVGDWVRKGETLALVADERRWTAVAYVGEADLRRIREGAGGRFLLDSAAAPPVRLRVEEITPDPIRTLPGSLWAKAHGGSVEAQLQNGRWIAAGPVYRVRLAAERPPEGLAGRSWRGRVVISGGAESRLLGGLAHLWAVLVRESGF